MYERPQIAADEPRQPLTDHVLSHVANYNDQALSLLNTAEMIRGKLFGHSSLEAAGKSAPEPVPSCFQDSFDTESASLSMRLGALENLLSEINGRL
jgi:hypothetical protein